MIAAQSWIAVVGALLTATLGLLKYFNYRSRRDRVSVVGQAFVQTVDGLGAEQAAKSLSSAVLLRRFFDEHTEQGATGRPYQREAISVIAALLRNTETGELQKLLADGLAFASSLEGADLQRCNLSDAYLGRRPRATVVAGAASLLGSQRGLGGIKLRRSDPPSRRIQDEPVNLSQADLYCANLSGCSFRGALAYETVFNSAIAERCVFEDAHLENADFRNAQLKGARFKGAWIEGANFAGAKDVPDCVSALLTADGRIPKGSNFRATTR